MFPSEVFNCRNTLANCFSATYQDRLVARLPLWSLSIRTLTSHIVVGQGWTNLCLTFLAQFITGKKETRSFSCLLVRQIYDTERNDLPHRAVESWTAEVKKQQWDMLNNIYVSFVFSDTLGWQWIVSYYINLPSMNSSQWAWTFSGSGVCKAAGDYARYWYDLNLRAYKLSHSWARASACSAMFTGKHETFRKWADSPSVSIARCLSSSIVSYAVLITTADADSSRVFTELPWFVGGSFWEGVAWSYLKCSAHTI